MPNWCNNIVEIFHEDPAQIERIRDAFVKGELCETFIPIKHLPEDQQYDAAISTWGTKWDVSIGGEGASIGVLWGRRIYLTFESAWTPPIGLYHELVRLGFDVYASYFEPGCCFVGKYENGTDDCFEFCGDNFEEVVPADLQEIYDIGDWFDLNGEEGAEG